MPNILEERQKIETEIEILKNQITLNDEDRAEKLAKIDLQTQLKRSYGKRASMVLRPPTDDHLTLELNNI